MLGMHSRLSNAQKSASCRKNCQQRNHQKENFRRIFALKDRLRRIIRIHITEAVRVDCVFAGLIGKCAVRIVRLVRRQVELLKRFPSNS